MKIQELEETPGMYFAMSNGNKIERIFYSKDSVANYIKTQNEKVKALTNRAKGKLNEN